MGADKTIQAYDKIASHYSDTHYHTIWMDEFRQFETLVKGKRVLEVGCGAGRDAELFVNAGFEYLGTDASEGMLKVARRRVPQGKFMQLSFYDLAFPENSFDGFWAAASLLHMPKANISPVLRSIRKSLTSEGIGFISVKDKKSLEEGFIKQAIHGGIERYFAFYTEAEFTQVLQNNGFDVVKSHLKIEEEGTRWWCFLVRKR